MYRQILVHPDDRDYQRILWRFSATSPIEEYRLCTVTYGTSVAPFQALRTVRELAYQDGYAWPLAAAVLLNDTFVDDILTWANPEESRYSRLSNVKPNCFVFVLVLSLNFESGPATVVKYYWPFPN